MRPAKLYSLFAVLALLLAACGGSSGPDRDTAIANLTGGSDALTDSQAACVVDGIGEDRLGEFDNFSASFQNDAEADLDNPTPELEELFDVLFGCVLEDSGLDQEVQDALGDVDLGALDPDNIEGSVADALEDVDLSDLDLGDLGDLGGAAGEPIDCSTVDGACDYGDDADFDALWDSCAAGSGEACDDLFFATPVGSRYEQFGNTCGDRGFEASCAEVYPG